MRLKQYMHFIAALDYGTISAAASHMHVTQPAMTRSIRKLELELGVPLLERGRLGVAPTPYGSALAEHARTILSEAKQATDQLAAMRVGRLGHVRLGVSPAASSPELVRILAEFGQERADVTISVYVGFPEAHFAMLRRAELDAAVMLRPIGGPDHAFEFETLLHDPHLLVARPTHPLAGVGQRASIEVLSKHAWVIYGQPRAEEYWYRALQLDVNKPDMLRIRCNTHSMIKQFLLADDLLGLLPKAMIDTELQEGSLVEIESEMKRVETETCLVSRRGATMSAALSLALVAIRRLAMPGAKPTHVAGTR